MRTTSRVPIQVHTRESGVSLLEMIVFIVVVSIALVALLSVYNQSARANVDPIVQLRLLEAAQSRLDEIIALKYDESTPTGGVPACGSGLAGSVACTNTPDANMNDVDDFSGPAGDDSPYPGYQRTVTVGVDGNRKLISVTVSAPGGQALTLSAYRYNF